MTERTARRASTVRPGDVVADCGGEEHEVIDVERVDRRTVILHAADDLAIITDADHPIEVVIDLTDKETVVEEAPVRP